MSTGGEWKTINGTNVYVTDQIGNHGLRIRADINYQMLLEMVKKKTGMENSAIKLTFQHPGLGFVMLIGDDADVAELITAFSETSFTIRIYVEVLRVAEEHAMVNPCGGRNGKAVVESGVRASDVIDDCIRRKGKAVVESGVRTSVFVDDLQHNTDEFGGVEEEDGEEEETLRITPRGQYNLIQFGKPLRFVDGASSDESEDDEHTEPIVGTDPFYFMPPIPSDPQAIGDPTPGHSSGPSHAITLNQTFDDKKALLLALKFKAVTDGIPYRTKRSSSTRLEVFCSDDTCKWFLTAKPLDEDGFWQVRSMNFEHSCSSSLIHPNIKQADSQMLGTIVHDLMCRDHSMIMKPNDLARALSVRFNIDVNYKQAWRAREYAFQMMVGNPEDSFAKLPIYFHNLKKHNPGSLTHIRTDQEDRFESCYMALGVAVSIDLDIFFHFILVYLWPYIYYFCCVTGYSFQGIM